MSATPSSTIFAKTLCLLPTFIMGFISIDLLDLIICSSCLLPRAANPSLVSNEAVPVPAFCGFAINAATKGTSNFSDKAIA